MKMLNKLFSVIFSVCVFVSASGFSEVFAQNDPAVILEEDFNTVMNGGIAGAPFNTTVVGDADAGVVEVPDARNKSLYLRGGAQGYASFSFPYTNPSNTAITLSFRFMAKEGCCAVFPAISDVKGNSASVFTLNNNTASVEGCHVSAVNDTEWHYAEIIINHSEHTYRVSIDGNMSNYRFKLPEGELSEISFNIGGDNSAIYLDDVRLAEASFGLAEHISFPTELWTTNLQQQVVDDISFSNFTMFNKSRVAYKNGQKYYMSNPVREIDGILYVPLRFVAEKLGAEVVWNDAEQAVFIMFAGKTIRVKSGETDIYANGEASTLSNKVLSIDGASYISAEDIAFLLGQKVSSGDGYIMFGSDWDYYERSNKRVREELYRMVKYERPSGEEIFNALISNNKGKGINGENRHPRIYGTAEDFDRIKSAYTSGDAFVTEAVKYILKTAEDYLDEPVWEYMLGRDSATRRCYNASTLEKIIGFCSIAWKISGDTRYAERAKKELLNLASFPEMGVTSMLDMGDTSNMLGFGYDWLYDYLTSSERMTVRDAIVKKVFDPLMYCYQGNTTPYEYEGMKHEPVVIRQSWVYSPFNWNIHINHGALISLFAIADEDFTNDEVSTYIKPLFGYIFRSLEFFFDEFYPDGAWQEGPGYGTGCVGASCILMDSIVKSLGTDFGLLSVSGVKEAIRWAQHMKAPVALFNYSDCDELSSLFYDNYLFAASRLLKDTSYAKERKEQLASKYYTNIDFRELLWYEPGNAENLSQQRELDAYFRKTETTTMRSGWGKNDLFLGFHSGLNGINHAQIDTGSFVFDWNNVRWAADIGVDAKTSHWYTTTSDWGLGYRERAEGHNTIVIDDTPYYNTEGGEWPSIVSDDFENYSIASDPSVFVLSKKGSIDSKAILETAAAPMPDNPQNKAFHILVKNTDNQSGFAQYAFGTNHVSKAMEIGFKFRLAEYDKNTATDFINIHHSNGKTMFAFQIGVGGKLRLRSGSTFKDVETLDPETWYDIRLVYDIKNSKYNLYIDDKLKIENYPTGFDGTSVDYVRFQFFEGRYIDAYMDDFRIKVHPDDKEVILSAARLYDQTLYCNSPIVSYQSKPLGAFAVTDMTQAYNKWASSAKRGVMLTDLRNAFVVRDEITLNRKSDVYWFCHSRKKVVDKIEISPDGQSAVLENTAGESRVWVQILSGGTPGKLEVMECDPLPGSPNPSNQANNSIFQKLAVKLEGVSGDVSLAVAFIPLKPGESKPTHIPYNLPFDKWSVSDGEIPKLDSLMVNGRMIEDFEPTKTVYTVPIRDDADIPVVTATAFGAKVNNISQASAVPGVAEFVLEKDGNKVKYTVIFTLEIVSRTSIQGYPISEDDIITSSFQEDENPPKNAVDGSIDTRFTALGKGEWIMFNFKEPRQFDKLDIAWYWGAERKYSFEIQCSNDADNWETVFKGNSSGQSGDFETYVFDKTVNAQFIRIVGYGSDKSLYNNFAEVR